MKAALLFLVFVGTALGATITCTNYNDPTAGRAPSHCLDTGDNFIPICPELTSASTCGTYIGCVWATTHCIYQWADADNDVDLCDGLTAHPMVKFTNYDDNGGVPVCTAHFYHRASDLTRENERLCGEIDQLTYNNDLDLCLPDCTSQSTQSTCESFHGCYWDGVTCKETVLYKQDIRLAWN